MTPLSEFVILHLLITVCTQFHHLFFGLHLSRLPTGFLLKTSLIFLLLSSLLTRPIQFYRLILTNEIIPESSNSCISSLLYCFLQLPLTLIPAKILLQTFLSNVASRLAISLFTVQDSARYVAAVLINV